MDKTNERGEAAFDREYVTVEGSVEHVVYHNEENGYTVCEVATDAGDLITAVGTLPFLGEGEQIKLLGNYEIHGSYGRQFRVEYYEKELPTGADAIRRYLRSGAVRGIGPKTADRIVDSFGTDTFEILEKSPGYLSQIPGITAKRAEEIGAHFREQFGMRAVMLLVGDYCSPAAAVRIYKRFGSAAVDMIKRDPYILCEKMSGIGFARADRLAQSLGFAANDPFRVAAGVKYVLRENAAQNGHCYLPRAGLRQVTAGLLTVEEEEVNAGIAELVRKGELAVRNLDGRSCLYLPEQYEAENDIAARLRVLENAPRLLDEDEVERMIRDEEMLGGIHYPGLQRVAIKSALRSGVMILTGGPGTGKTTVIRAVISIFERLGLEIALAAPTGRAAKRMSEATSHKATTLHRLLEAEIDPAGAERMRFRRTADEPLEEDVIIVDECSMVDAALMAALLRAMKNGSRILLIGDADQLPSVGAGNVLLDLIESERFTTVCLKEIFRQAKESHIILAAHAINEGEAPELHDKEGDFFFLPRGSEEEVGETVASLLAVRLPRTYGESIREGIQVITPSRKGAVGTVALNGRLQAVLNPPAPGKNEKKTGGRLLREGDRVMQIRNNYEIEWQKEDGAEGKGIFNGDIGILDEIRVREEKLTVRFDEGRVATYDFSQLDELEHAFAITVHKSQGSEYPAVVIPMMPGFERLMTRELLYTAVTRAKDLAILVGREDAITAMVGNSRRPMRYTALRRLLADGNE